MSHDWLKCNKVKCVGDNIRISDMVAYYIRAKFCHF